MVKHFKFSRYIICARPQTSRYSSDISATSTDKSGVAVKSVKLTKFEKKVNKVEKKSKSREIGRSRFRKKSARKSS